MSRIILVFVISFFSNLCIGQILQSKLRIEYENDTIDRKILEEYFYDGLGADTMILWSEIDKATNEITSSSYNIYFKEHLGFSFFQYGKIKENNWEPYVTISYHHDEVECTSQVVYDGQLGFYNWDNDTFDIAYPFGCDEGWVEELRPLLIEDETPVYNRYIETNSDGKRIQREVVFLGAEEVYVEKIYRDGKLERICDTKSDFGFKEESIYRYDDFGNIKKFEVLIYSEPGVLSNTFITTYTNTYSDDSLLMMSETEREITVYEYDCFNRLDKEYVRSIDGEKIRDYIYTYVAECPENEVVTEFLAYQSMNKIIVRNNEIENGKLFLFSLIGENVTPTIEHYSDNEKHIDTSTIPKGLVVVSLEIDGKILSKLIYVN